jgi:NAD-specific glutamate dehydrogenase
MLENMGLHIVSERPYELKMEDEKVVWVQDFDMLFEQGKELNLDTVRDNFQEAFDYTLRGITVSDGFNRLILACRLHWRQVKMLRAYCKYLLQSGSPFSLEYMATTLSRHRLLAYLLVELFDARFNPERDDDSEFKVEQAQKQLRKATVALADARESKDKVLHEYLEDMVKARGRSRKLQVKTIRRAFVRGLASVRSLDEDRILHAFYSMLMATLRTNFYQTSGDGLVHEYMSFKFDSELVPDLPKPRPFREIWVYSPRVEGIHLRMGAVARGGLRWSDRKEDFRTEVLGLMKAQNVKNTMIVPVGAKGGFWLGDAFASGGSVGYDHKGMGITAKGAWEGVKRHFRELGTDIQKQPFTVVGIGDMSGDVFGNGMLLSKQIRLKAAFNHLHIFIDPDPDEKSSWKERNRLFAMPRSSWTDYNRNLISKGGGIFSRKDKTIPISKQVRDWLGIEEKQMAPHQLIRELIKAEADLLWNGGIGTYVKSSKENHAEVGDLANNPLRADGNQLQCKVVGEGGNLGMTQLGRIEYAQNGGRINTDFVDNSAGVDCSDHEVNIKILLNQAMRAGKLDQKSRNALLAQMTDEVSDLVLRSNYLQTQALSMMEKLSGPRLGAKQHFIEVLEQEGQLDRDLEGLPDDEELVDRRNRGLGLTRPELSVLLSYSKIRLYSQLLDSDIPEDPYFSNELKAYFPTPLQEKFAEFMPSHRLRRELVATQVTNSLVNRMGVSFVMRMRDDTSATPSEVARSYAIAREIFDAREYWAKVESLDNKVDAGLQTQALLSMWTLLRQVTRWIANHPGHHLDIEKMVSSLRPGMIEMQKMITRNLNADEKEHVAAIEAPFVEGGFPKTFARRIATLHLMTPALDVVATAAERKLAVKAVANVYFGLGESLGLKWLKGHIESLSVDGQWHAHARGNLRDELHSHHRQLVNRVLDAFGEKDDPVAGWTAEHQVDIDRVLEMMQDMRNLTQMDYATLSVAVRSLGQLLSATEV